MSTKVEWPKRPRASTHHILGPRRTWVSRCGRYRIDRFGAGSLLYIVQVWDRLGWRAVATCRKLRTAQRKAVR